jgi:hypothetical protein
MEPSKVALAKSRHGGTGYRRRIQATWPVRVSVAPRRGSAVQRITCSTSLQLTAILPGHSSRLTVLVMQVSNEPTLRRP